jgi:hypothetical protein
MPRKTVLADIAVPTLTNVKMGQPVVRNSKRALMRPSRSLSRMLRPQQKRKPARSPILSTVFSPARNPKSMAEIAKKMGKEPKKKQLVCNHREKIKLVCLTGLCIPTAKVTPLLRKGNGNGKCEGDVQFSKSVMACGC